MKRSVKNLKVLIMLKNLKWVYSSLPVFDPFDSTDKKLSFFWFESGFRLMNLEIFIHQVWICWRLMLFSFMVTFLQISEFGGFFQGWFAIENIWKMLPVCSTTPGCSSSSQVEVFLEPKISFFSTLFHLCCFILSLSEWF